MIGMAAALFGDELDKEAFTNRSALLMAVQHQMFCRASGACLDISSAVLVTLTGPNGGRGASVYTGPAWDEMAPRLREQCEAASVTVEVIDGRDFTAKGAYRAAVRARLEAQRAEPVAPPVEPVDLTGQ